MVVVVVVVGKSFRTGVHIKGGGFHTFKPHLMIGSRRPWWQQHAAIPGPLPIGSGATLSHLNLGSSAFVEKC